MATEALEDRLTVLENELAQIKHQLAVKNPQTSLAGWERIFGSFAESEGFDEAVRLGREYREAQHLMLFIVIMVLLAMTPAFAASVSLPPVQKPSVTLSSSLSLPGDATLGSDQIYPFRDAYAYMSPYNAPPYNYPIAHSILNVGQTKMRQVQPGEDPSGALFSVDIRFYNDTGETHRYYNIYWSPFIPMPGRLALYDSQKHYVCDLLERMVGSSTTISEDRDWTAIPGSSYVGMILYVSLPYPTYIKLTPGTYYLQVIYLHCVAQTPSETNMRADKRDTIGQAELFRSNAVPITIVVEPALKSLKHEHKP